MVSGRAVRAGWKPVIESRTSAWVVVEFQSSFESSEGRVSWKTAQFRRVPLEKVSSMKEALLCGVWWFSDYLLLRETGGI